MRKEAFIGFLPKSWSRLLLSTVKCFVTVLIVLIFLTTHSSCDNHSKSQIETAFEEYIKKNLGDPNDYMEITDIIFIDSLNLVESANKLLEVNIDSVAQQTGQILYGDIMPSVQKINPDAPMTESRRRELKELVGKAIIFSGKSLTFTQHHPYVASLRDTLNYRIGLVNTDNESNKEFLLKARIKVDNKPTIQEYYVLQTAIVDSIMISNKEIPMSSCPRAVTEILTMIQLYGKEVNELLEYRNELIELQKQIKTTIGD